MTSRPPGRSTRRRASRPRPRSPGESEFSVSVNPHSARTAREARTHTPGKRASVNCSAVSTSTAGMPSTVPRSRMAIVWPLSSCHRAVPPPLAGVTPRRHVPGRPRAATYEAHGPIRARGRARGDGGGSRATRGRCIRHAPEATPRAVRPLAVPVIEPAFRAALMPRVRPPPLAALRRRAAGHPTVALPPVAGRADVEHLLAPRAAAPDRSPVHELRGSRSRRARTRGPSRGGLPSRCLVDLSST